MSSDKWFMRLVISLFMRICPEFLWLFCIMYVFSIMPNIKCGRRYHHYVSKNSERKWQSRPKLQPITNTTLGTTISLMTKSQTKCSNLAVPRWHKFVSEDTILSRPISQGNATGGGCDNPGIQQFYYITASLIQQWVGYRDPKTINVQKNTSKKEKKLIIMYTTYVACFSVPHCLRVFLIPFRWLLFNVSVLALANKCILIVLQSLITEFRRSSICEELDIEAAMLSHKDLTGSDFMASSSILDSIISVGSVLISSYCLYASSITFVREKKSLLTWYRPPLTLCSIHTRV